MSALVLRGLLLDKPITSPRAAVRLRHKGLRARGLRLKIFVASATRRAVERLGTLTVKGRWRASGRTGIPPKPVWPPVASKVGIGGGPGAIFGSSHTEPEEVRLEVYRKGCCLSHRFAPRATDVMTRASRTGTDHVTARPRGKLPALGRRSFPGLLRLSVGRLSRFRVRSGLRAVSIPGSIPVSVPGRCRARFGLLSALSSVESFARTYVEDLLEVHLDTCRRCLGLTYLPCRHLHRFHRRWAMEKGSSQLLWGMQFSSLGRVVGDGTVTGFCLTLKCPEVQFPVIVLRHTSEEHEG